MALVVSLTRAKKKLVWVFLLDAKVFWGVLLFSFARQALATYGKNGVVSASMVAITFNSLVRRDCRWTNIIDRQAQVIALELNETIGGSTFAQSTHESTSLRKTSLDLLCA
jgi:hypothetical protein